MITDLTALTITACSCSSAHVERPWDGKATDISNGRLVVSDNGRSLMHENGIPFFWMGDTAWELFHRLSLEETETYLEDRRSKGFTVIQAVILKELGNIAEPNKNGLVVLHDNDPLKPDERFFEYLDSVIRMAAEKGLYIGLLPTWGDKVDRQWGNGPVIFDSDNAWEYGRWLGRRYKDYPNIIWINGGDRSGGGDNFAVWDALAKGIKAEDPNHLMTYHPQGEHSSSMWFSNSDWLDFNTFQSGHAQDDYAIYQRLLLPDYAIAPARPVLDSEPRYENLPVRFDIGNGRFTAHDTRMAMYQSLVGGAFGHTYGANEIGQMYAPPYGTILNAEVPWREALDFEGAADVIHARRLLERFDAGSRRPATDLLLSGNTDNGDMAVATRGNGYSLV